jgi:DNA-damage-inducible protein D
MKKELVKELFEKFEQACYLFNGMECWSARELQEIFNYTDWRNFLKVADKAKEACKNSGEEIPDHFVDVNKMVQLGSGSERQIEDIALTQYACYLIAQNGDPAKIEVAFAQTYFAVQTRKQEVIEQRLLNLARVTAREKLSKSEKKLSDIIYERGVDEKGFAIIRSQGDKALFGGFTTLDMKKKLQVSGTRPLADFLPTSCRNSSSPFSVWLCLPTFVRLASGYYKFPHNDLILCHHELITTYYGFITGHYDCIMA